MDENSKDKFRDSISSILDDLPDEVPGLDETHEMQKVIPDNGNSAKLAKAKKQASKVMNNLLKFYLSEDIIEEHEYIKAKADLDEYALGMLIRQMQNSESAITTLMDTIDGGDVSPRMFEVLSDLQRTLLDIIKSQTMYMVAVEENAKKISRDLDVYHNGGNGNKKLNSGSSVKTRGTKDLMRALQDNIKEEDIKDIDEYEDTDEE